MTERANTPTHRCIETNEALGHFRNCVAVGNNGALHRFSTAREGLAAGRTVHFTALQRRHIIRLKNIE